jgi:hypothetical protein
LDTERTYIVRAAHECGKPYQFANRFGHQARRKEAATCSASPEGTVDVAER